MRKSITKELSHRFWQFSYKMRLFRCPEVTIDNERVDFLTYDKLTNVWRCYEVKSSKEDFYSNAKWTFVGHYNYFVMEKELYEEVKHDIPAHVGVTDGYNRFKNARKQELQVEEQHLMWCFTRSLYTQYMSQISKSEVLERQIRQMRSIDRNIKIKGM